MRILKISGFSAAVLLASATAFSDPSPTPTPSKINCKASGGTYCEAPVTGAKDFNPSQMASSGGDNYWNSITFTSSGVVASPVPVHGRSIQMANCYTISASAGVPSKTSGKNVVYQAPGVFVPLATPAEFESFLASDMVYNNPNMAVAGCKSCGPANNQSSSTPPTTGLCLTSAGATLSQNVSGPTGGQWSWQCTDAEGTPQQCTAPYSFTSCAANPAKTWSVGSANCVGSLPEGTPTDTAPTIFSTNANKGQATFSCDSSTGTWTETSKSCTSSTPPSNGTCGSANTIPTLTAPSGPSLCSSGTASSVSGSGPWSWTCSGSGGGTPASCSAPTGGSCYCRAQTSDGGQVWNWHTTAVSPAACIAMGPDTAGSQSFCTWEGGTFAGCAPGGFATTNPGTNGFLSWTGTPQASWNGAAGATCYGPGEGQALGYGATQSTTTPSGNLNKGSATFTCKAGGGTAPYGGSWVASPGATCTGAQIACYTQAPGVGDGHDCDTGTPEYFSTASCGAKSDGRCPPSACTPVYAGTAAAANCK